MPFCVFLTRSRSELEPEQFDGIVARQPLPLLLRQAVEMILHNLPRMREGHVEVRIIVGPHAILLTPPWEEAGAHIILKERAVDVLVEDFARLALDRQLAIAAEALEIVVPLLEQERQPADLAFGHQQAQLWIAVERAGEDEI